MKGGAAHCPLRVVVPQRSSMVNPIATVDIRPNLPPSLERLRELAYNLRWSWDHETIALFRRLDRDLWDQTERNPSLAAGPDQPGCPAKLPPKTKHLWQTWIAFAAASMPT